MLNRTLAYGLLAGFALVMVVLLMLDNPAAQQAQMEQYSATVEAQQRLVPFPELGPAAQMTGIEVLDEATGAGLLVMRDEQGRWYGPKIAGIQEPMQPAALDQLVIEDAAAALLVLTAERDFDASIADLEAFGLRPTPAYRVRFRAITVTGEQVEAIFEIGNANPDNMGYYMYVLGGTSGNGRIYLIEKPLMDIVLDMLTSAVQTTPVP